MATRFIPGSFFRIGSYGQIGGSESAFVTTWNTENLGGTGSLTKVILLPWTNPGQDVDWGDGTVNQLNTHTYAAGGIKTVTINGPVTGFRFASTGDKSKVLTVESGQLAIDNSAMFWGCNNLTSFILSSSSPMTSTNLSLMFHTGSALLVLDLVELDTSGVTNFSQMLQSVSASAVITGIEDFNVTSATNMAGFLQFSTLSTTQYSTMLVNYEAQSVMNNVSFSGGNSQYSAGAAATARADLIADHTWSITDGGAA